MPRTKKTVTNSEEKIALNTEFPIGDSRRYGEAVVSTPEEKEAVESVIDAGSELLKNSDAMNAAIERARKFEENNQLSVFDYSVYSEGLKLKSYERKARVKTNEQVATKAFYDIAQDVKDQHEDLVKENKTVRGLTPYQQWLEWCAFELDYSKSVACRLLKIGNELVAYGRPEILPKSYKGLTALAESLANADDEGKQEIIKAVETATEEKGKALTEKEIKEITKPYLEQIEELKKEKEQLSLEFQNTETKKDNKISWLQSQVDYSERQLKQAQETLANQNKQIKELGSEVSQKENALKAIEQTKIEVETKKNELNEIIAKKANAIAEEKAEKELDRLKEKEKELEKEKAKIAKELKEAQSLKNQVEREKDNLYRLNAWIDLISEFNQEFTRYNDRLKTISSLLIKLPNLLELSEKDRKIADQRIYSQMSAFNQNLDDFGKYNIRIQNAIRELDTSVLSVGSIDVEVKS